MRILGLGDSIEEKDGEPPLGRLDSVLFTVNGNVVCSLGEGIFRDHLREDAELLFPALLSSLRSFSRLFEMDLKMIIAVGRDYIYKVILSPQYLIEKRVQKDPSEVKLAIRLGLGEEPVKSYEGFAIGFEINKNPFYIDFPEVLRGLELHTLREMAEVFFTEFGDKILKQDFNFDSTFVKKTLSPHGSRRPLIVDVGHPRYQKGLDATIYYTMDKLSLDIHYELENSNIQSDALARIVTTIYTSLNDLLGFANNPDREGAIIIDFGGLETLGSSLFTFGKQFEEHDKEVLILSIMVGEKEKYFLGGRSEIPDIIYGLREKTLKTVQKPIKEEQDSKFIKWD